MAISKGSEYAANSFKMYQGIGAFQVLCVNPNKKQMKEILNREVEEEPVYLSEGVSPTDPTKPVKRVRIDFYVKTAEKEHPEVNFVSKLTFFVQASAWINSTGTKVQVIDKFGRTAWPTLQECENKAIPQYATGPANIDASYRKCYRGEAEVTDFIKTLLGIGNPSFRNANGEWVLKSEAEMAECECRFEPEDIKGWFNNDFKSLQDAVAMQPNNTIKLLVGIRTTEDGRRYQDVYNRKFVRGNAPLSTAQNAFTREFQNRAANNVEYSFDTLKEYEPVAPTEFKQDTATVDWSIPQTASTTAKPEVTDDGLPF